MRYVALLLVGFCLLPLVGCVSREARDQVRNKHAEYFVISQRLTDNDPANDPTPEELKELTKSAAKDWESMDRIINNWKPKDSGGIKTIDLDAKPAETKPAEAPKPD